MAAFLDDDGATREHTDDTDADDADDADDGPPAPAALPAGRAVELAGRGTTWVYDTGPPGAPVLLLLHGWTTTAGVNWLHSFAALAEDHRVVALDHRGHGRGVRSTKRFRLEDCADDAVALIDALDLERVVPVGYSMGGPVAQLMWRRHPDRVDGLVLCATAQTFRGRRSERAAFAALAGMTVAARVTPRSWHHAVRDRISTRVFEDDEVGRWARAEYARNDPRAIAEAGYAIGRFDSRAWLGEVDVPTAVLTTERDAVVPLDRQLALADTIAGASRMAVDGDHAVCALHPEKFVPRLLDACADVTARAARRHPAAE